MKTATQFTAADWERIERDWSAWWAGELDRPLLSVPARPAGAPDNPTPFLTRFPLELPANKILDYCEPALMSVLHYGDSFPHWWVNFGAGVMAAFLGAGVEYTTDTTWFHPLDVNGLDEIHLAYDAENVWWRRVLDVTQAALRRWGSIVTIAHTDIGGNLDILASLRGTQQLLFDVVEAPEEVDRLTREITQLWLQYYDELHDLIAPAGRGNASWTPLWQPARGYMLQSDFSYMISPQMYKRWVVPDLNACCRSLDYGFYHLDGAGQIRHLALLLDIPRLRGIQWVPGAGAPTPDKWLDLLRRIREGGKLVQLFVSPQGALDIMRELGGRGFMLVVHNEAEERALTPAEAEQFLKTAAREGYI